MDFPPSPFAEANAKLEWIDAKYTALQSMAANAQFIQAEIDATSVSVWSPGHEVKVTVGSTGLLRDLEYGQRSESLGNEALSRLTLATLKTALLTLAERIAAAAEASDDPATGSVIAAEYRSGLARSASRLDGDGLIR